MGYIGGNCGCHCGVPFARFGRIFEGAQLVRLVTDWSVANQSTGDDGQNRRPGCDEAFYAVVKTHKRRLNKIYNSELTMTKILNQV